MSDDITISDGEPVYDEDGEELGVVTGATSGGFIVSVADDAEYVEESIPSDAAGGRADESEGQRHHIEPEEEEPGPDFGEGFLMWRCAECGEMGELDDGIPAECPNCGSDEVNKWKED